MSHFNYHIQSFLFYLFITFGLIGCGGGGGGGTSPTTTPTTSSLSFPLATAMANTVSANQAYKYTLTTLQAPIPAAFISGQGTFDIKAAVGAVFEGQTALEQISIISISFTISGNTTTVTDTLSSFSSTNYAYLGSNSNGKGGEYCVVQAGGITYPVSVKVGDTGLLGSIKCYVDNTKAQLKSTEERSYIVEPDTATTAIVNFMTKKLLEVAPGITIPGGTLEGRARIDQVGSAIIVVSGKSTTGSGADATVILETYTPI